MQTNRQLRDLTPGDRADGFYILKSALVKTTAAGKPFLSAVLADKSGELEAKAWDYAGPLGPGDEGRIVRVQGTVSEYRGAPQVVIDRGGIRLRTEHDPVKPEDLVPTAPMDLDAAYREVEGLVSSMKDADYAAVCRRMLQRRGEEFRRIPAAKSVHHSFLGGLLMHTLQMLRLADFLAGQYGDLIDRDLLLAGTLLHDFAKAREFRFSELGLATGYSTSGQLLGHLVMGAQEVAETAAELGTPEEKSVLLQHLLLSHHGEPEFGAAVRPMCVESELLSLIDMVDSRMEIYREVLAEVPEGEFSGRVFALDKRIYHHR